MARNFTDRAPEDIEDDLEQTRSQISGTIDAIQSRLTPGQAFQDFYDLARGGPTDYVRNLGLAAKNNPVPLALVAVGLTWLATSGGRTPSYLRGSHVAAGSEGGGLPGVGAARGLAQSASEYAGAAGRAMADATHRAGDQAGSIVERVSEAASGASDRVRRMADDARTLASEWSEDAKGAAETSRARIRDAGGTAQKMTAQLRDKGGMLWRDQPLIVGAVGIAIGALLGALLPSTEREDAALGEARDRLIGQAKALGADALREATEAATDMAGAAMQVASERAPDIRTPDDPSSRDDAEAAAAVPADTAPKDAGRWQ